MRRACARAGLARTRAPPTAPAPTAFRSRAAWEFGSRRHGGHAVPGSQGRSLAPRRRPSPPSLSVLLRGDRLASASQADPGWACLVSGSVAVRPLTFMNIFDRLFPGVLLDVTVSLSVFLGVSTSLCISVSLFPDILLL